MQEDEDEFCTEEDGRNSSQITWPGRWRIRGIFMTWKTTLGVWFLSRSPLTGLTRSGRGRHDLWNSNSKGYIMMAFVFLCFYFFYSFFCFPLSCLRFRAYGLSGSCRKIGRSRIRRSSFSFQLFTKHQRHGARIQKYPMVGPRRVCYSRVWLLISTRRLLFFSLFLDSCLSCFFWSNTSTRRHLRVLLLVDVDLDTRSEEE